MENLTLEQKVILHLAKKGYLTNAGDVQRALKEFEYAGKMNSRGKYYLLLPKDAEIVVYDR